MKRGGKGDNEEKEKLVKLSKVSLILDTHDDIFSDFNSRPYDERGYRMTFYQKPKKAVRKKPRETIELKFLIPSDMRNLSDEEIIT